MMKRLMFFCFCSYGLQIDTIRLDFKSGLETLLKDKPIRAIFLGVRIGDPTAVTLVFNLVILFCFEVDIFWSALHPHVLCMVGFFQKSFTHGCRKQNFIWKCWWSVEAKFKVRCKDEGFAWYILISF